MRGLAVNKNPSFFGIEFNEKICDFISHVKLTFKIKDVKSLQHDNVKITRKGGAGLQHNNNLTRKIQRE
jgi:hypothetical protein